ncbi:MAG: DUF1622 domain-containing protein [Clostridia bacterium]|nr:DUF1622 domain-containing protein [Clostridia bacterium]
MYEKILQVFDAFVEYAVLLIELIGVGVILFSVGRALWGLWKRNRRVRLELAEGIALALEFKLGGELLRTLTVRDWNELLILGAVILLRAAMTFLIQWEIRLEKKSEQEEWEKKK